MAAPTTPVTVGTAGHIDHGKTLLVEQLTGMRADRPYERERGMTIDIGYAEMRTPDGRRVGFVDLPGHERFIRNMVAGATGIDLALLVVAADDGVMPQTREHMEILDLLGVRRGIAVLNKIDAVDEEMRELAMEELQEFLAETGLRDAPVFACSAATGEGVDAVREALLGLVGDETETDDPGAFFMGVQRTFAATGFGCIATGVPAAGDVAVGAELELLPARKKARVRAIEIYHEAAERAQAGHRTALNVAGLHHDEVARGMVLAAPGAYRPGRHIAVRLNMLASARRPLKHAGGVRLLTGTLEEMGTIYLLEGDTLKPGDSALVEIRTKEPVTVRDGAPFIVRSDNAKETLGGGAIVAVLDAPIGRKNKSTHERLGLWEKALPSAEDRIRAALALDGAAAPGALAMRCQLRKEAAQKLLDAMRESGELVALPGGTFVPAAAVDAAVESVRTSLDKLHRENPLLAALPIADVRDAAGITEHLLSAALQRLADEVVVEARTLRRAGHSVELDPALTRAADQILGCLSDARFAPPPVAKLAEASGLESGAVRKALTFLGDQRRVREVAPGLLYTKEMLDEGLRLLQAVAAKRGNFEPVDAKAVLGGISRKWLIPLLEFYDRIGATRRDGNARLLTRRGETMVSGGIDAQSDPKSAPLPVPSLEVDKTKLLRRLPAIDKVLKTPEAEALKQRWLPSLVDDEVRAVVADVRAEIQAGSEPGELTAAGLADRAGERLAVRLAPGVQRCINATGVVLHTGLGRAALAPAAIEALAREASGYSVVSVDREEGKRLRRETAVGRILCALTGAEAVTVVNNNAAATLIALNTLAAGREAILSRGQLVEIGGSYRMPEVFKAAGVRLCEVGTTNRTHLRDYAAAIGEDTGLLLRVHPSNFKVVGFTKEVGLHELVELGRAHDLPVMDDLGAGALLPLAPEPEIAASLEAGADLVTCSGDKLIGGPQAGIVLGSRHWVDRVRKNALFRTLRVDKLALIALEATLRLFLRPHGPGDDHPTLRMLRLGASEIAKRARSLRTRLRRDAPALEATLFEGFSQVGSGSLPGENLPTTLISLKHRELSASTFARRLRLSQPPVYTRIVDDQVCLDPRTLLPGDDRDLIAVLKEI